MSVRARPVGCCAAPPPVDPLPVAERDRLVIQLRALADPTRLEIFRLISAQPEPICVCDVVDRFDVSQPTISHHLKVLREAGLVEGTRLGTNVYYRANRDALGALCRVIDPTCC
jgi:DNA-binding transcriptional ArsR family regulator